MISKSKEKSEVWNSAKRKNFLANWALNNQDKVGPRCINVAIM